MQNKGASTATEHLGYFERRAVEARSARNAARTEFSEDELAPLKIKSMARSTFASQSRDAIAKHFEENGVYFIHDPSVKYSYAVVLPISAFTLFELRDILNDRREFAVVPKKASVAELEAKL